VVAGKRVRGSIGRRKYDKVGSVLMTSGLNRGYIMRQT
jgi:hypothetical protein